jgi:hypothetical protein
VSEQSLTELRQAFLTPADEFTPVPFWFWNDDLVETEIIRQIRAFCEKGVLGFVVHPRIGIPRDIRYLGNRYMELVETAVREAERLGMVVFLYDEAMYPSGSAHGMVVEGNPEYASRGLRIREYRCPAKLLLCAELASGERLVSMQAVRKVSEDTIDASCTQIIEFAGDCVDFVPPDDGAWSILLFVETATKGVIRGIHFGEDDWERGALPAADLLNPDAVAKFTHITYDGYYQRLGAHFGKTIKAIFTDEPNLQGKRAIQGLLPWTDGFLAWYVARGGAESDLPALWFGAGPETEDARRRYRKALHSRLASTYYRPISEWCATHHIAFTGHPHSSDDIGSLAYFDIPGQDLVLRWVAPEDGKALEGAHSTLAKCASDAARHAGRRRNLVECFGCCGHLGMGWSLTAADMKWYMDWLFVRGVNWLLPHAFYYSIRGPRRSGERPPDVGPNNIWWAYYETIAAYMKRLSWLMTDSTNQAYVAVLCEVDHLPWAIAKPLYQNQIEFNYLIDDELASSACTVNRGTLEIQRQRYVAILVEDPALIVSQVHAKLQAFVAGGGVVIVHNATGQPPALAGALEVTAFEQIPPLLRQRIPVDVTLSPPHPDLRVSHVVRGRHHFYLLVNEGDAPITGSLNLGCKGRLELWDAWEGTVRDGVVQVLDAGELALPLHLESRASLIVVVDPDEAPGLGQPRHQALASWFVALDDEWIVKGDDLEVLVPHPLRSWTLWPTMAHFSGTLTYERAFDFGEESPEHTDLDLGEVHELAHVWVNGHDAGFRLWAPYRFDVTPFVRPGANRVRVEVTNSLANKMDGEELPSGLLGPVTLAVFEHEKGSRVDH